MAGLFVKHNFIQKGNSRCFFFFFFKKGTDLVYFQTFDKYTYTHLRIILGDSENVFIYLFQTHRNGSVHEIIIRRREKTACYDSWGACSVNVTHLWDQDATCQLIKTLPHFPLISANFCPPPSPSVCFSILSSFPISAPPKTNKSSTLLQLFVFLLSLFVLRWRN